jgi:hypothetical protein
MLSKAKHLEFSDCYEVEILRLRLIYDTMTTVSKWERAEARASKMRDPDDDL